MNTLWLTECLRNKWGLRKEGRIVVAPIYRMIKQPVGCYCAFEKNPRQWGVMAVDGQIEVEPRYEQVAILIAWWT